MSSSVRLTVVLLSILFSLGLSQYGYPNCRLDNHLAKVQQYFSGGRSYSMTKQQYILTNRFFDIIVVGSGTAGTIVASLVTEHSSLLSVLVLDRGVCDNLEEVFNPGLYGDAEGDPSLNEFIFTTNPGITTPFLFESASMILGGNSNLDAGIWLYGNKVDYDGYAANYNMPYWKWDISVQYMKLVESYMHLSDIRNETGQNVVFRYPAHYMYMNQLKYNTSYQYADDINDGNPNNVQRFRENKVIVHDGPRAYKVNMPEAFYTEDVLNRPNLYVQNMATVTKIIVKGGKPIGVMWTYNGTNYRTYARKEVVVSAGTFNSVKLLELSGIGPRDILEKFNINPVLYNNHVGKGLTNHILVNGFTAFVKPSLYTVEDTLGNVAQLQRWETNRTGEYTSQWNDVAMFVRTPNARTATPNIWMEWASIFYDVYGSYSQPGMKGIAFGPDLMYPLVDNGTVAITSSNINDPLAVSHYYLSKQADIDSLVQAIRIIQGIIYNSSQIMSYVVQEVIPPPSYTDAQLGDWLKTYMYTGDHNCCTNKIGKVLDARMKVMGLDNLRVCDASAFPKIMGTGTLASVAGLAARCANYILQDHVCGYVPFIRETL